MISPVMPVYRRTKLCFDRGEGVYLFDKQNKRYLDFAAGIAVNALGHGHPHVVKALKDQADKLWHVSNMYTIDGMEELGQRFVEHTFADTMFFCNSGTEAIECAIKMARKYHDDTGNPDKYRIITFSGAFHGRTIAAISASNRDKVMDGFGPALEGFDNVTFNDIESVKAVLSDETAAIMVEPIQGEGGIRPADEAFLKALRTLCDEHGLLLIFDEIQCGMARTGALYAHEHYGVKPDIMTSAKGVGNGFPFALCMATEKAAVGMTQGSHGSTYGGNPLAMAVGHAVLDVVLEDGFMAHVDDMAAILHAGLQTLAAEFSTLIQEVRGKGLMIGLKIADTYENKLFVEALRERGLLTVPASDNVIRLLPPLVIQPQHCEEALQLLRQFFTELSS